MIRASSASYRQIEALIRAEAGLSVEHLGASERARVIRLAMERAGIDDEQRYLAQLRAAPSRLLDLASSMSVGETYFFRELEQLTWAMDQWLPRHLLARRQDRELAIWSAGCASGEEAYTVAMLLAERGLLERAAIVGTDLSEPALARARAGRYGSWSLRATPEPTRQLFFAQRGAEYQLDRAVMSHVRFERQNLADEAAPLPGAGGPFDLVLCRNVLIYLTREAQLAVSLRLAHSLAPGGMLIAGASDPFVDLPGIWQRSVAPSGVSFTRLPAPGERTGAATSAPSLQPRDATSGPRATHVRRRRSPRADHDGTASDPQAPAAIPVPSADERDDSSDAVEACRAALQHDPLALELHLRLVSLLIELNRDDEAQTALRRLLYVDRHSVMGHWMSALLLRRRGHALRAARAYRHVAALCADQPGDSLVPLGEGLSHAELQELAAEQARAIDRRVRVS